jgi:aspartate racemase
MTPALGPLIGVLGGMGPVASAAFVRTLYASWRGPHEQMAPRVLLYSDPTFPDRTTQLLDHQRTHLRDRLCESLNALRALGATHLVICCMTIHELLPEVPDDLRARVWSMLDAALALAEADEGPCLLLCSTGARRMRLFERHPRWPAVSARMRFPTDEDQDTVHRLIYEIKRNADVDAMLPAFRDLSRRYGANAWLAGCSELHLVARALSASLCGSQPESEPRPTPSAGAAADRAKATPRALDPLGLLADRVLSLTAAAHAALTERADATAATAAAAGPNVAAFAAPPSS